MVNNTNFSDRQHVEASLIEYRSLKLGKNQKIKNYVVTGVLQTAEEYSSKSDLKAVIDLAIEEGEKYLK